jgi:phospholipase A1
MLFVTPQCAAADSDLAQCRSIAEGDQRLACYDALSELSAGAIPIANAPPPPNPAEPRARDPELRWSIVEDEVHRLRPHRPNYVILRQTSQPNDRPLRASNEFQPAVAATAVPLDHNEMKFQVSLKAALLHGVPLLGGDLWFAYTQQSSWQVWNRRLSRPFRETDYEPELLLSYPLKIGLTEAWSLQNLTFGFNHQSNGRGDPLSRSWNRLQAQVDLARGTNFEVLVRPWWRIPEDRSTDDNPDIQRYLGYGDVVVNYRAPTWIASLLLRNNLEKRHNRGAMQLDVAFPCLRLGDFVVKMQLFSGFGESLIDYNHRQTTIGVGVEAAGWMDRTFARRSRPAACG